MMVVGGGKSRGYMVYFILCFDTGNSFGILGERREFRKTKTLYRKYNGYFLLFRGMFYIYLAIATVFNYLKYEEAIRAVVGYTIALAILEGGYNIFDGIQKTKEYYKKKYEKEDKITRNNC